MKWLKIVWCLAAILTLHSCKKFLEEKPDKKLVVPSTLADLQAVLDNTNTFNAAYPFSPELSADNYYITSQEWQSRSSTERNLYIWDADVFNETDRNDWSSPYTIVYGSNVVLDQLSSGNFKNIAGPEKNNVEGQALFFRSYAFWHLLQVFAKPYDKSTAGNNWGIALRLSSDLNKPTIRSTLMECYMQVITDLKKAAVLLPSESLLKTRPSKPAAYAMLARTFLSMKEYKEALAYADSALQLNAALLDYNDLPATAARPIPLFNKEVLLHSIMITTSTLSVQAKVDSLLYSEYDVNDLRRSCYYNTTFKFKGSYDASARLFNGLATDELYLVRAECYARTGNTGAAMNDLNTLLLKRWKAGTFIPLSANSSIEALGKILQERRKELVFRGLRWTDLRRLNKEPQLEKTLVRIVNNQTYTLPPNDDRYVLPIPSAIIEMTGMPQNHR